LVFSRLCTYNLAIIFLKKYNYQFWTSGEKLPSSLS
jgi:hypothetical protein